MTGNLPAAEKAYPIYAVSARWIQDGEHDPAYPRSHEGLPEGRIWNSTGYSAMLREPDLEKVHADALEWWRKYASDKTETIRNPELTSLEVKFVRNETWCGGHFSHWTFDTGQSGEEALASFERFVCRMENFIQRETKYKNGYPNKPYCLMGAEDRYRWCGRPGGTGILGFSNEPSTSAPCRCDGCKTLGLLRIDH